MSCEDYPCCGHLPGDCPTIDKDGNQRWKCAGCDTVLEVKARSSLCGHCMRIELEDPFEPDWQD
jgi:transposase-like protein